MAELIPRTACRTPAEGRDGVTNIPTWKFDCIRQAILDELAQADIRWGDLTEAVRNRLSTKELDEMGKLGWHVIGVKLEMEVRGEISRVVGKTPQVITLGA